MDYLSLEKILTPLGKYDEPVVALRIVSTMAELGNMDLHISPPTMVVHRGSGDWTVRYFQNATQNELPLETTETKGVLHLSWPSSVAAKIRDRFDLLVTTHTFDKIPDTQAISRNGKQTLVIPAFGRSGGEWKDGYMGHFSEEAKVYSLVPPGYAYLLFVPLGTSASSGLEWTEACASLAPKMELQRQCVVTMLRASFPKDAIHKLRIESFSMQEAVRLLLLRQAFPSQDFEIQHPIPKKEWPARFKNFLESIRATWTVGTDGEVVGSFFAGVSEELLLNLVPVLNSKTKILAGL